MTITNCFAVPHAERGDEVAIGKDFNRQMLSLCLSHIGASKHESVVGWYGTALPEGGNEDMEAEVEEGEKSFVTITDTSSLIHDFYAGECEDPIHLVVDTSMSKASAGVPMKAYRSVPLTVKGMALANVFHEVRCSISTGKSSSDNEQVEGTCSVAERIVMDKMSKGVQARANGGSELTLISAPAGSIEEESNITDNTSIRSLESGMKKLLDLLENASEFVDNVVANGGGTDSDKTEEIGRKLTDTISMVPAIDCMGADFDKMIYNNMQDLLMVSYLSNLTKTQLSVAEKLNSAIGTGAS